LKPDSQSKSLIRLRLTVGTAIVGTVVMACALLGILSFEIDETMIVRTVHSILKNDTGVAAVSIDPVALDSIRSRADEKSGNYREISNRLRKMKSRFRHISNIFIVRMDESGLPACVIDIEENPARQCHAGDIFRMPPNPMLDVFKKPHEIHVGDRLSEDKGGRWFIGCSAILNTDDSVEAALCMDINTANVAIYESHYLHLVAAVCLFSCIVGILLAIFLTRAITKSLLAIENEMRKVQSFHVDERFDLQTRILEVARMKTALDAMKSGLRSFGKYIPVDLVRKLILIGKDAATGAEKMELTVMFTDIADFSTIAERMDPSALAEYLADYLKGMTGPIIRNKGTVNKYLGDGIMSFWGAPVTIKDHVLSTCSAALECRHFSELMAEEYLRKGLQPFYTRIGINTGEVFVGNFGTEEFLDYTAVGDHVNLAARIEGLNKQYGTQILMSEYTAMYAGEAFVLRPIDTVRVKGRRGGVKIFELVGPVGDVDQSHMEFLTKYNEAFNHYLEGRWESACRDFSEALMMRDDRPTWILLLRCEEFRTGAPPEDWKGIVAMDEK